MKKLRSLLAFTLVLLVLSTCSTLIVADHLDTVPLRAISEAAGARVFWDASRNEAAIYKGADEILVSLANRVSPSFTINGATYAYGGSLSIDYVQGVILIDTAFADKLLAIFSEDGPYVYRLDESGEVIKIGKSRRQDSFGAALTDSPWSSAEEAYAGKIDEAYAFDLAKRLAAIGDSGLGGKTAGSDGEHKAAKLLYEEMQAIGLQNVHMDPFPVDRWQFNDASLSVAGVEKEIKPYSYASGKTPPDGIEAEIIYAGKGTVSDYEDMDPRGKIVLVDLDQRGEWWVTYPTIEAANRGAIAIINNCTDGYGQLNEETYNTQDFCGPVTIPSLNITMSDANLIKEALAEADGLLTARLYVDNEAGENGTSYNIWGEIQGKTDEAILVGDHYDAHFEGFQDDACAVGLTLAVAKGMLTSGYEPERTIRFILHGAEEYGRTNTRYDWSIGAWEQINSIHPEWAGKTLTYINFELPAYEFSDTMYVASTPVLQSFINGFIADVANPSGVFKNGVYPETQQETSWADNFSYSLAGVPSAHNGFLGDENGDVFPFYITHYHSNFDDVSTYNADVMAYNIKFYGALAIAFDQNPFLELDFGTVAESLLASLDDEYRFSDAAVGLYRDAVSYSSSLRRFNRDYRAYLAASAIENAKAIAELRTLALEKINPHTLTFFKAWQDNMLRLTWEDEAIFPHEEAAANVALLTEIIERLEDGDADYAIDELLWQIDSVRAWYLYYFSKETTDYFRDYVLTPINAHNYWGSGRITGFCDGIEDLVASLLSKYGDEEADLLTEIDLAKTLLTGQQQRLESLLANEKASLLRINPMLWLP